MRRSLAGRAGLRIAIAAGFALGGRALLSWQAAPVAAPAPSSLGRGYLGGAPAEGSVAISPAPPAPGSAAEARDIEASRAALALRGGARWTLATADADLGPAATAAFSCAAQVEIGPATTPGLDALLRRAMADLGMSTAAIKRVYQRPRPFIVNNEPSCTPDMEQRLRGDGSYPSGHSAIGYGWALILAQLLPDRAAALVARGRAFGDSRRICNAHWLSDVEEGRVAAAMTVARLNADSGFTADLNAARAELRTARTPPGGCDAEAHALAAGGR